MEKCVAMGEIACAARAFAENTWRLKMQNRENTEQPNKRVGQYLRSMACLRPSLKIYARRTPTV